MSRIGEANETDWAENTELVAAIEAGRGWIPNVFRAMLFSPSLTQGWVALANAVRLESTLDTRTRELVILLVAHLHDARYEWDHHVGVARDIGVTDTEIGWLAAWPTGDWSAEERAVLTFAAATASRSPVPQWCVDELSAGRGNRYIVDLAVTTSYYVAAAHFTSALAIEPESGAHAARTT